MWWRLVVVQTGISVSTSWRRTLIHPRSFLVNQIVHYRLTLEIRSFRQPKIRSHSHFGHKRWPNGRHSPFSAARASSGQASKSACFYWLISSQLRSGGAFPLNADVKIPVHPNVSEVLRPLFLPGTPVPLTGWKGVPYSRKRVENLRDGCRLPEVRMRLSRMIGGPAAPDRN